MLKKISLYWNTVRYLRSRQILWRLWYSFYWPKIGKHSLAKPLSPSIFWKQAIDREAKLFSENQACFLGLEKNITDSSIWVDDSLTKLWLYNLHYFDDLTSINGNFRFDWHTKLIDRWIDENPPIRSVGWEAYPLSLRIVNWVKWLLMGNKASKKMIQSLVDQTNFLHKRLEYHILGNHLLANAKALCFSGKYFSEVGGEQWYEAGINIYREQLAEQILSDGGHFELSPMYHLIVLEDLLDLEQLHNLYGESVPTFLSLAIEKMINWSLVMRHPDGEIPFFNDAAFCIAATPQQLDSYARNLGFNVGYESFGLSTHLRDSGYIRLENGAAVVLIDVASIGPEYLPGHAHADTLSFEMSIMGIRVVVNGGTSVYGQGTQRQMERGTLAHSTVAIDGENSSEVWGGFRVARRAKTTAVKSGECEGMGFAEAAHDGYERLPGKLMHKRRWELKASALSIKDEISGNGIHSVEIIFPLGPQVFPKKISERVIECIDLNTQEMICRFEIESNAVIYLEEIAWHPEFSKEVAAWRIRLKIIDKMPISHESLIIWSKF